MENFIFCVVDNVSLLGNFNSCIKDSPMKLFCEISKLRSLIKEPACFKNQENHEAPIQRCSYEKVFWKYAANLQENTHAEVRFH